VASVASESLRLSKGGDAPPQHQVNFYGTVNVIYQIQQIAFAWKAETGLTHAVNDISLPMGGVFDLGPIYGGCPFWRPTRPGETNCGHQTHMLGFNADIPCSSLGTLQQRERYRQIAVERQANPLAEGNHFHLRFSY
jgi:murein endopeptidase